MLTATTAAELLFGLFGVKLVTGESGSEEGAEDEVEVEPVVEGDDDDDAAEIFAVGGMSIVRVSLPKMSRNRLVGAGNACGECLGGVRAAAAMAAVTGPSAEGCSITEGCWGGCPAASTS